MNNRAGHLEEGDLLRLIDGELTEDEAAGARGHIEACWNCRSQFQEFETVIGEYVRYQKIVDEMIPPPPRAWPEVPFHAAAQVEPPAMVLLPARKWFDWRWAVAAGVLLGIVAVYRLQTPPTVNAAQLLRKARTVEAADGFIRVEAGHVALVRPAVLRNGASDDVRMRAMFERAHFDWQRPLSARTFAAWHDGLPEKRDDVRMETGGSSGNAYVIRTSTHSSELRAATLTLRARDLQPVREMLEFTGETVEIERAAEPGGQPKPPEEVNAAPAPATNRGPSPESTLHRLLQVFSTLHGLGADLGDPIEIRQNSGQIDIDAVGLPPSRQEQLRAALEGIPSVAVHFDSGRSRSNSRKESTKAPQAGVSAGQAALENILGSAQAAEDFTDRALDSSDAVLARIHAVRALAKAFPPPQEAAMTAPDRQLLTALRREHAAALTQRIAELRSALQPVVALRPRGAVTADTTGDWQTAAEQLFLAAQQFDETLNRELAGNTVPRSDFGKIADTFAQLDRQAAIAVNR